jgi:hypothetical protein
MCALRQMGRSHLHFEENLNTPLFKLFVSPGCKQKNHSNSISIKVVTNLLTSNETPVFSV